ncbi:hypothetical protein JB92DRAFT_75384 [Gautieria morchelliformis]|nr:hypothetical protein JB92DRAFT_75384 [Gautieria morchelliformis]
MGDSGAATSGAQLKLKTASRCRAPRRESRRFACDFCRKRKTKCDMPLVVGVKPRSGLDVCINCTILGVDCTFGKIQTQKCVPKQYVSNLETRQERLQRLLGKFCSSEDIVAQVGPYIKSWMDGQFFSREVGAADFQR